jgi:transposase-like protein
MTPGDTLKELLEAALTAPADKKAEAIRVLRGEVTVMRTDVIPSAPEPYRTLRGLSRDMGISASTLWRWRIPGHRLGGRPKYKQSEVAAYLASEEFKRRAASLRAERRSRKAGGATN